MDYGRKDFFLTADMGFRDSVAPSWFEGWKATMAYNHMPLTRYISEQNQFAEVERDPAFTLERYVSRMKELPETFLPYHETFARAKNDQHFDFLRSAVQEELSYKQTAANAPLTAQFVGNITDVVNLSFLIPGFGQVRAAKSGLDAIKLGTKLGFGAGVASEARRAPFAYADDDWEAAANIGMSTIFSPVLSGGAYYLKPFIKSTARKAVDFANGRSVRHTYDADGNIILAGDDSYVQQSGGDFDAVVGNPLGSPTQRMLSDPNVPQEVKQMFHALAGNASVSVQGNRSGNVAQQSVAMRIVPFYGRFMKTQRDLRDLHAKETSGYIDAEAPSFMGAYSPVSKDFDAWFSDTVDRMVMAASNDPRLVRQAQKGMTTQQADAIVQLENLFKEIDDDAIFTGVFRRNELLQKQIDELTAKLDEDLIQQKSIKLSEGKGAKQGISQKQYALLQKLDGRIVETRKKIAGIKRAMKKPTRKDFAFPIYYNKQLLMSDDAAREGLTQKFEAHYTRERANADPDEVFNNTPREDAERTVARILQEDADDFENLQADFAGGSKHLRNRKTNIPVHEVMDYIIKDEDALYSYIERMGKKIAFAEAYGGKNIDEVLADLETALRKKGGFSEAKIARAKADFYGDYERVMGSIVRRPDRWDNQTVKALRSYTGWVYLPYAAYSAITDVGSVVLAHGAMPVLKAGWSSLRDMGYTSKVFRQANMAGELLDITRNVVAREILSDNVRRIKPNMLEKTTSIGNKVFYTANGLAPITLAGKTLDQVLVQDKFFKLSQKMAAGKISKVDAEFMARHGINQEMAEYIAKMPAERHPSANFFFSATDKWPDDTAQARKALRTYQAAIDAHANNTIIMATTFDKPQIMDGLLYMKDNAFFQQARKMWPESFKIEDRVSTAGQKMVRMDSQLMTLPFTFMNFAFGANNKIINALRDPNRQNKMQGVMALIGLSYLSLEMKDKSWWRGADNVETVARVIDHSGLLGIYSDLGYMGLGMAVNSGLMAPEASPIPPKYIDPDLNRRFGDFVTEPFGAPVGLGLDMYRVAKDFYDGNYSTARNDMLYVLPYVGLPYIAGTARDLVTVGRN